MKLLLVKYKLKKSIKLHPVHYFLHIRFIKLLKLLLDPMCFGILFQNMCTSLSNTHSSLLDFKVELKARPKVWKAWSRVCFRKRCILSQSDTVLLRLIGPTWNKIFIWHNSIRRVLRLKLFRISFTLFFNIGMI